MFSLYFTQPLVLLLLALLPALAWWQLRRRQRAVQFPVDAVLRGLPTGRGRWVRAVTVALRVGAAGLLVVALAGPRWPDEGSRIPTEGMSIALVVDVSQSMTDEDFPWDGGTISRLEAVKRVFRLFVQGGDAPGGQRFAGRPNDLLSLVVFAEFPQTICPQTLDHAALIKILNQQDARKQEWTNIGDAIALALHALEKSGKGKKALVLFTDGEQTKKGETILKPLQAGQFAGNLGIPIYAIDAGKDLDAAADVKPEEIKNRQVAKKIMEDLAAMTRGRYFHATDADALLEVCRDIDALETEKIETFQYRRYYQAFAWFSLAAFGLLAGLVTLESTVWRRVP